MTHEFCIDNITNFDNFKYPKILAVSAEFRQTIGNRSLAMTHSWSTLLQLHLKCHILKEIKKFTMQARKSARAACIKKNIVHYKIEFNNHIIASLYKT